MTLLFLLYKTPKGATASDIVHSIIETANGLIIFNYTTYIFEQILNGRDKSWKKLDVQEGHKGKNRKDYSKVDKVVKVPRPDKYIDENLYKETCCLYLHKFIYYKLSVYGVYKFRNR